MKRFFIISVDVEGVLLKDGSVDYSSIVAGVPLLLDLFNKFSIYSTFFVTSDVTQNFAHVLKEIVKRGHEIGCHELGCKGCAELKEATEIIGRHLGVTTIGFRAHRHHVNHETFSALSQIGYKYDSSVVSSSRLFNRHYFPQAPNHPYHLAINSMGEEGDSLIEIPISALPLIKIPLGLSYIKLFGLNLYKLFLSRLREEVVTMYLHPYDLFQLPGEVDASHSFAIAHKRVTMGFKILRSFLEFLEEKFSPTYIRAKDILDCSDLVSRGGVEPSVSTM